jgi:hypothetical protein
MAYFATRDNTVCRGKVFKAGEEITTIRQPSDARLMKRVYGVEERGVEGPVTASPVLTPVAPPRAVRQPRKAKPSAPKPATGRYKNRRLKSES